jgi:hypothetical protein
VTTPNTPALSGVETGAAQLDAKLGQILSLMTSLPDTSASGGPAAPTGLRATVAGTGVITLSWNAVPDPDVVWDVNELLVTPTNTFRGTVITPTIALSPGIGSYQYGVYARNSYGRSPLSLTLAVTVTTTTGGSGSGGTVSTDLLVPSTTVTAIELLTQNAYTALATKNARTLYITTDNAPAAKTAAAAIQSSTLDAILACTQATYDALTTKDPRTLYVIVPSPPAAQASASVQSLTAEILAAITSATYTWLATKDPRTCYVLTG